MEHNLISGCHKCKTKFLHAPHESVKDIFDFYKKHADCSKIGYHTVQTIMDNVEDLQWMNGELEGGYDIDSIAFEKEPKTNR